MFENNSLEEYYKYLLELIEKEKIKEEKVKEEKIDSSFKIEDLTERLKEQITENVFDNLNTFETLYNFQESFWADFIDGLEEVKEKEETKSDLTFSEAMALLETDNQIKLEEIIGGFKVSRDNWEEGKYLSVEGSPYTFKNKEGGNLKIYTMFYKDGSSSPYTPTIEDMLAKDWLFRF